MTDLDTRVANVLAHVEQQRAQDQLQEEYEAAAHRNSDIDPTDLAEAGEIFGWNFDAAADGLRHVRAEAEAEYLAANPPATISEAVDRMMQR